MAHSRLPAALLSELKGEFSAREAQAELPALARSGRARLSQKMANSPVQTGFSSINWLKPALGIAALALIAVLTTYQLQPDEANSTQPVTMAAVSPAPVVLTPVEASPVPAMVAAPVVVPAIDKPDNGRETRHVASLQIAPSNPESRIPNPATTPLDVRLSKSSGGILVTWLDGEQDMAGNHAQYELLKTCVGPQEASISGQVRLNSGEWLDTLPDNCSSAATVQYQVRRIA